VNIRKIKRMCAVKGCRNREAYTTSRVRDFGNTVIICEECAKGIVEAISKYGETGTGTGAKQGDVSDTPLFYGHLINPEATPALTGTPFTEGGLGADKAAFACSKCGREFTTAAGRSNHEKACKVESKTDMPPEDVPPEGAGEVPPEDAVEGGDGGGETGGDDE